MRSRATPMVSAAAIAATCALAACSESMPIAEVAHVYATCSDTSPCAADAECVEGECLPRCQGGPACWSSSYAVPLGQVCWQDGCRSECDESHPCTQAFSCVDGTCVQAPCEHPEYWSKSLASSTYPILVHYRDDVELPMAKATLSTMEHSWQVETEDLGFWPPLPDEGQCGPDDAFDVFLWRTYRAGGVEVSVENPATEWDDYFSYMNLDPWGPYGGELLPVLVAHELSHGSQAAYDWWETPIFFEMTSQFVQTEVYPELSDYPDYLFDFQHNPDWAFDYNDDYATWYMYGSALYLFYLQAAVFEGDGSFVAQIWDGSRNPAGDNEPDFEDALESMLQAQAGKSFLDSVVQFGRWRYYTGFRDDGAHFPEGASLPDSAMVRLELSTHVPTTTPMTLDFSPGPMLLGAHYVELYLDEGDPTDFTLAFTGDPAVRWAVQVVPGLDQTSDGELLDLTTGTATLHFGTLGARTLIVLALPAGADDPEDRTSDRYSYSLSLTPQ